MLKYIAIITMLLDHIDFILFGRKYEILTLIGRIAFPLFIYLSVKSYVFYTRDKYFYIGRVFLFALISIPFVYIGFYRTLPLNILFTISFGLMALFSIESKRYLDLIPLVALSYFTEYGIFALFSFISLYAYLKYKNFYFFVIFIIALFMMNLPFENWYMFVFIPLVLIDLKYKIDFKSSLNKYFFYFFYPLHIAFLGLIK